MLVQLSAGGCRLARVEQVAGVGLAVSSYRVRDRSWNSPALLQQQQHGRKEGRCWTLSLLPGLHLVEQFQPSSCCPNAQRKPPFCGWHSPALQGGGVELGYSVQGLARGVQRYGATGLGLLAVPLGGGDGEGDGGRRGPCARRAAGVLLPDSATVSTDSLWGTWPLPPGLSGETNRI